MRKNTMSKRKVCRSIVLVLCLACSGCIWIPGLGPVPLSAIDLDGPRKQRERDKRLMQEAKEKNDKYMQAAHEKYDAKASQGDPVSQLNLARMFDYECRFYVYDWALSAPSVGGSLKERKNTAQPFCDEANKYIDLAVAANYPPALTYSVCRNYRLEGQEGPLTAEELRVLEKASDLGEPHAKKLMADYLYSIASKEDRKMLPPAITQLWLDASDGGDSGATRRLESKISTYDSRLIGTGLTLPENTMRRIIKNYESGYAKKGVVHLCGTDFVD